MIQVTTRILHVFREESQIYSTTSARCGVSYWQQQLEYKWKILKLRGRCLRTLSQVASDNAHAQDSVFFSCVTKNQISSTKFSIFKSMLATW